MKTLNIITLLLVLTGCNEGLDNLAKAIDKASTTNTATATDKAKAKTTTNAQTNSTTAHAQDAANSNSVVTTTTVSNSSSTTSSSSTTTTTIKNGVSSDDPADQLQTGTWVTKCDAGIIYKKAFANGIETVTNYVYQDTACQSKNPQVLIQTLAYILAGDTIQSALGNADFQIENDTLIMNSQDDVVYSHAQ